MPSILYSVEKLDRIAFGIELITALLRPHFHDIPICLELGVFGQFRLQ